MSHLAAAIIHEEHHPKESHLLFPKLARARPELMPVIHRLETTGCSRASFSGRRRPSASVRARRACCSLDGELYAAGREAIASN